MMPKGDPLETLLRGEQSPPDLPDARSHPLTDAASASTATRTRRRAKPKPPPSDADLQGKRKRHADAERERIHRKQHGVVRMRDEVAQLERQLHSLSTKENSSSLSATLPEDATSPPWHTLLLDEDAFEQCPTAEARRELYVRALTASGWLRRERASLQAKLDDCGLLEATVESLLKDLVDATIHPPRAPDTHPQRVSYRDLLSDECYALMRDLANASTRFAIHDTDANVNASSSALDWSALCQHDGSDVRFSLTKTFPACSVEQLAPSAWLAFHDVRVSQKIFSPTIRVDVLQRISDDVLVVRWQIDCRKVVPYVGHCRNLVFRWKTPDGCFVGCRTIDELEPADPTVAQSNPTNGAFDQFYWAKFTQDPSSPGCQVTFAGRVGVGNGTSSFARFLCTEIPISIFRWESMVVGPLFNFEPSAVVV